MAADLASQFLAASDVAFQRRVASALAIVAVQIYTENPATPLHAARAAYAVSVVTNAPVSMVTINQFGTTGLDKLVYAWTRLLAAQGLDNSAPDATIQTQVGNDWNAMAGA